MIGTTDFLLPVRRKEAPTVKEQYSAPSSANTTVTEYCPSPVRIVINEGVSVGITSPKRALLRVRGKQGLRRLHPLDCLEDRVCPTVRLT